MWQLDNRTPFAAERGWIRDRDGSEVWLVAVKATFDVVEDGRTVVAPEQPPVLRLPEHHGDPATSSVRYDADLILTKTTTDIVVVGDACAPRGTEVRALDAGFDVGGVRKVVRVFGDRTWSHGRPSTPARFTRIPLRYEFAFGGRDAASRAAHGDWDARNPVGCGYAADGSGPARLPNIESAGELIRSRRDRPTPAGLGVVASHWQPRAALAGTYDEHWQRTRMPLLAADLDDRYYQSVPPDQRSAAFLQGGEPVRVIGMNPDPVPAFALPRLRIGFETRFYDGDRAFHADRRLHTVILEPNGPRVSLVWHSRLPCHHRGERLEKTVITVKSDLTARWREPDRDDRRVGR